MKILLIGGTGFVSGTVAKVALEAGHDVTVVTRGIKPIPAGLKQITADRFKPGSLEAAIANAGCFDFIVDCFGFIEKQTELLQYALVQLLRGLPKQLLPAELQLLHQPLVIQQSRSQLTAFRRHQFLKRSILRL